MLHLTPLSQQNVWSVVNLHVRDDQKNYVATNAESLIEAYLVLASGGQVFPFGIFDDDTPVGFVMIGYDGSDCDEEPPASAAGNYCLWRFMIGEEYQHSGYGREALRLALDFIRTFPCGKADCCYLSYEPENEVARRLYASFGFEETGEISEGEVVAVLRL